MRCSAARGAGRLAALVFGLLVGLIGSVGVFAQARAPGGDLEAIEVQPNFYMIAGAGGNIAVDVGDDGVVLVDTGSADNAEQVLALIKQLTKQPIRYIINTSADIDHVGGNDKLSLAGASILPTGYQREGLVDRNFAPILAEQHVQDRMMTATDKRPAAVTAALPTMTYSIETGETQRKMFLNGQGVQVMYQKAAHSDGDSLVHFRRSDVVVTGDVLDPTRFPVIDPARGGSVQGVLDSLNRILDMAIASTPFPYQEGGTLFVPGHGRICTTTDVVEYRDMVAIIRDRVQDGVSKGKSLAQVQQSNPAQGYRRRYGSDSGAWTTDMFVAAIYNELSRQQKGQAPRRRAPP